MLKGLGFSEFREFREFREFGEFRVSGLGFRVVLSVSGYWRSGLSSCLNQR